MNKALIDNYTKEELELIVKESQNYQEVAKKLGYTAIPNNETVKNRINLYNIDTSHFTGQTGNSITKRTFENVFCKDSTASQHTLRNWYLNGKYTPYECAICGAPPIWQGKEITLILDHINGEHKDNRLENLRWVCPNCNQQLPTTGYKKYRAEQKTKKQYFCKDCGRPISAGANYCAICYLKYMRKVERPNRDELKALIRTTPFTTIGKQYGVTDNTIRKWCKLEGLPSKVTVINSYNDEEWNMI